MSMTGVRNGCPGLGWKQIKAGAARVNTVLVRLFPQSSEERPLIGTGSQEVILSDRVQTGIDYTGRAMTGIAIASACAYSYLLVVNGMEDAGWKPDSTGNKIGIYTLAWLSVVCAAIGKYCLMVGAVTGGVKELFLFYKKGGDRDVLELSNLVNLFSACVIASAWSYFAGDSNVLFADEMRGSAAGDIVAEIVQHPVAIVFVAATNWLANALLVPGSQRTALQILSKLFSEVEMSTVVARARVSKGNNELFNKYNELCTAITTKKDTVDSLKTEMHDMLSNLEIKYSPDAGFTIPEDLSSKLIAVYSSKEVNQLPLRIQEYSGVFLKMVIVAIGVAGYWGVKDLECEALKFISKNTECRAWMIPFQIMAMISTALVFVAFASANGPSIVRKITGSSINDGFLDVSFMTSVLSTKQKKAIIAVSILLCTIGTSPIIFLARMNKASWGEALGISGLAAFIFEIAFTIYIFKEKLESLVVGKLSDENKAYRNALKNIMLELSTSQATLTGTEPSNSINDQL